MTVRAGLRGAALVSALTDLLGKDKVLGTREDLLIYEYDGAVDTATPDAVVLPNDTADVAKLSRFCHEHGVPIVPRGRTLYAAIGGIEKWALWILAALGLVWSRVRPAGAPSPPVRP